jgi:hypothetical protein
MLAWLVAALSVFRPLDFGPTPPEGSVEEGKRLFLTNELQSRTLQGSREVLGRWFDGRAHQEADLAIWLSPELLGRWYGWLAARDSWPKEVIQKRWREAKKELEGQLVFIVRLAALPKQDPLEFGNGKEADPQSASKVKFRLSYLPIGPHQYLRPLPDQDGMFLREPNRTFSATTFGKQEADVEKREPGDILKVPFYHLSSLAPLFLAEGETDDADDGIPLGGNYGAVYLVTFRRPVTLTLAPEMWFEAIHPHKVSRVTFRLTQPVKEKPKPDPWVPYRAISAGGAKSNR